MNWLKLPPLSSLRAFSAFAEKGGVVQAGAALNVSHAAISQQLRVLEKHMGVALVRRDGKSLSLSPEGAHLARAVQLGFGSIGAAVEEVMSAGGARPVHVSLTPTFAASWLMPRLPEFQAKYPEISLTIDPSPHLVELTPGGVDVAIRYGSGGWPGVDCEMLLETPFVVVAAPSLLGGRLGWTPEELSQLPWLEEFGTTEASTWLARRGVDHPPQGRRISLPGTLLLEGLRAGQGVTATVRHFVEQDIKAGRLVELHTEPESSGYHVLTAKTPLRPAVKTFVSWLRRQAGDAR